MECSGRREVTNRNMGPSPPWTG
jgi:hypothetical protein